MADDIKPEVIKKTQDALGKHIKKPQLTEKLLKKPPFRFLHDIVTNVIKESRFLQGLFTDEELNHENIRDRDGKIAFLDKLINCVKLATGLPLTVRSTKIVAGLEPTRTNELLQAIGQALDKRTDSSEAVQEILNKSSKKGGTEPKKKASEAGSTAKPEASKRDRKDPSTSSDAKKSDKKDPGARAQARKTEKQEGASDAKKRSSTNQRPKEKDAAKPSAKPGKSTKEEPVEKPSSKISAKPKEEPVVQAAEPILDTKENLVKKGSEEDKIDLVEPEPTPEEGSSKLPDVMEKPSAPPEDTLDSSVPSDPVPAETVREPTERQRPVSALGRRRSAAVRQQRSSEEQAEPKEPPLPLPSTPSTSSSGPIVDVPSTPVVQPTPIPTPTARPPSAAPGPTRAGDNQASTSTATPIPLVRPRTAARQGSARPGAPRLRNRGEVALVSEEQVKPAAVNLIVEADGVKEDLDEDDNLVVLENTAIEPVNNNIPRPDSETVRPSSQQGHLVAQILETQKELETGSKVAGVASQAENSGPKVEIDWEASRQRERGTALREVQRLCDSIQTVTRAAHPIGKLLDSLQEDVDSMQQELEHWQNMQRSLEEQLLAEEALTVQSTQPLQESLQQLQQAVLAQQQQLSISKANIIANDQRIHKLLAGGDSAQKPVFTV